MTKATASDALWAFEAYQAVRDRLPAADFGTKYEQAANLAEITAPYDLILLDAYGVLNVGEAPIPGAAERIAWLRRAGKQVIVVSNSAGYPKRKMMARFNLLGFDFAAREVATSREALLHHLLQEPRRHWGMMLNPEHDTAEFEHLETTFLADDARAYDGAKGFLLIGSDCWSETRQTLLETSLRNAPRPVLVGNPDIVAPRGTSLSREPGHFAHRLADATGIDPVFLGKPFRGIFDLALSRQSPKPEPGKVLMVGDTLHTDILGGRKMGFATALVTDFGALAGLDVDDAIRRSGIIPDYVINGI